MKHASFGRKRDDREQLLRNLATSVILYESVTTTEAKARVVQPIVERLIRIAQTDAPITARRRLASYLTDENAVTKTLTELKDRFSTKTSGFTRRLRLPARLGDGAPQVLIQLTNTVLLNDTKAAPAKAKASQADAAESTEDKGENNE